ncbi:WD40 repeat domain-containing protein [Microcoleus sp. FACHB-68]|uniref:WD40 repeat domain-containing protein n=1 Tax=Microcoleus sp. FACHB-68 TaxID=2692826 RepID=UPI00168497BD|nr:WD40 repeat domain-containing protein [Microcoleus sp. FACHB-68]MBD1939202.1 hypothetical protein [Microcoleus sp. FACHB-68]
MRNHRQWLEIVEYLSIAGSAVGTVVAVASQQVVYAATPISLSLLLNLLNRRRLENLPAAGGTSEIIQVQRQLLGEVESVRRQLSAMPVQDAGANITVLRQLSEQITDLPTLQAQLAQINHRLDTEKQNFEPVPVNSNLEQQIEELRIGLIRAIEQIAHQQHEAQNGAPRQDLMRLFTQMETLQQQQIILKQTVAPIEGALTGFMGYLDAHSEQFNRRIGTFEVATERQVAELRETLTQMQQRLNEDRQNLASMPATSESIDLRNIETALAQLSEELAALPAQMPSRNASPETFDYNLIQEEIAKLLQSRLDFNPIREELAKLRSQYADLQESVDNLAERLNGEKQLSSGRVSGEPERKKEPIILQPAADEKPAEKRREIEPAPAIFVEPASKSKPKLWRCVKTLTGHSSAVTCLAISAGGNQLATGSYKEIKLWNLKTGEELQTLAMQSEAMSVSALAFSPNAEIIASANADIEIWNLRTGQQIRTLETSCWALSVAISPDGKILVSGGEDPVDETGSIQIWKLETGELLHDLGPDVIDSVAISPDGQILASAGLKGVDEDEIEEIDEAGLIQLRRLDTGKVLHTLTDPSGKVYSVAISADGKVLASGSHNGTVKLWNLRTGELLRTLAGHSLPVHSVAISSDGKILASGSSDQTVKLWNLQTGELLQTLTEHSEKVSSVAFSPDGQILVSCSSDMTIKVCRCD